MLKFLLVILFFLSVSVTIPAFAVSQNADAPLSDLEKTLNDARVLGKQGQPPAFEDFRENLLISENGADLSQEKKSPADNNTQL